MVRRYILKGFGMNCLLLLAPFLCNAQSYTTIDSLKSELENTVDHDRRVDLLLSIIDFYSESDFEKALLYSKTALVEAENAGNEEDKANIHFVAGILHEDHGFYDDAISAYEMSLDIYSELGLETEVAKLDYSLGDIYKKKGLYNISLQYCLRGLKIFEELNDSSGLASVYNCLGSLYKYQGDNKKALEYYGYCLDLRKGMNDYSGMGLAYNNIGVVYELEGNTDLALNYYNSGLRIFIETGDKKNQGITLGNIGNIYTTHGEYEKALEYLRSSFEIHREIGYSRGMALQYQNLGEYYRSSGDNILAVENLMLAYKLFRTLGRLEDIKEVSGLLSAILFETGNFEGAYNFQSIYMNVSDSIFDVEKIRNIALLEQEYTREKEEKIHQLEDQQRRLKTTALLLSLGIICLTALLLYSQLKIKTRHQKLRIKNIELEKKTMNSDLELKQRELAASTVHMVKTNELINDIIKRLADVLENLKQENVPVIRDAISDLRSSLNKDVWEEFDIRFLKVHHSFYDNLLKRFPDLTSNEKRLSAFIMLDMSTKEISAVTNQTPHSINIARTRLRKKLGIANIDISLVQFLSQF